ncbi:MAG: hypothetical protein WBD36_03420 [Bacteroidota bacterium]
MGEAAKTLLNNTVKEWAKFTAERDKMKAVATEVANVTKKCVMEHLMFLKTQNIAVECDNPDSLKVLGTAFQIEPLIDATFPHVKATVSLKCGGAARSILLNPNLTISAGGPPFPFDQLKKAIPETFVTNAAEFVCDAFLNVARSGGAKE